MKVITCDKIAILLITIFGSNTSCRSLITFSPSLKLCSEILDVLFTVVVAVFHLLFRLVRREKRFGSAEITDIMLLCQRWLVLDNFLRFAFLFVARFCSLFLI